jgi:hypothetical protein
VRKFYTFIFQTSKIKLHKKNMFLEFLRRYFDFRYTVTASSREFIRVHSGLNVHWGVQNCTGSSNEFICAQGSSKRTLKNVRSSSCLGLGKLFWLFRDILIKILLITQFYSCPSIKLRYYFIKKKSLTKCYKFFNKQEINLKTLEKLI